MAAAACKFIVNFLMSFSTTSFPRFSEVTFHAKSQVTISGLLKNSGFVSGYRFSDTVSSSKSDAPFGAQLRARQNRAEQINHLSLVRESALFSPRPAPPTMGPCYEGFRR